MSLIKYIKRGAQYVLHGVPTSFVTANITYSSPHCALIGKKIIVTGGGHGLGFAMAKKFVDEGAQVLIAGRNEVKLIESSKELKCHYLVLDVNKVDTFDSFLDNANKLLGGANCLINNAGISLHEKTFADVTPESFDKQINTNLRGGFFLTQKFAKILLAENREGNILFVSSETGDTVDIRPYGWTKAAINSMMKGLAYQFAAKNIRVNAIAPGVTTSEMTGFKEDENLFYKNGATKRVYLPGEIAETATFLISNLSGCISGQVITLNNAKTINFRK